MRRIALATIVLLCISAAQAQTLYECAGSSGNSYQQTPCAKSARLVRSLETVPEPPPSPQQLAERARKAAQDRAESAFLSHLAGTDRVSMTYAMRGNRPARRQGASSMIDRCNRARAHRTRRLAAVGLNRTVDLLRQLDSDVWSACQEQ